MKKIKKPLKIILINPPSQFLIDQSVFPPLGILYIAAALNEKGYNPEVIDLGPHSNWEKKLNEVKADIIGITSTTPQFLNVEKIFKILKLSNPNSFFLIGGPHATGFPDKCLEIGFDSVVVGEGENAILSVVNDLESGKRPEAIVKFPYIQNIDKIPFPARDLIPIQDYRFSIDGNNTTTVITSRGCPHRCAYCSNNVWGKKLRQRSSENIIKEVKEIKEKYGFNGIMFFDDTFTINHERLFKICDGLKNLSVKWRCFIRANTVNHAVLKRMKDSGCVEVGIGIESGSQKILDIVKKDTTVEMNTNVVKICKELGLLVKTFILIGLPGETHSTLEETRKWLIENKPDKFDFCIYMPYVQSEIWDSPEKFDIKFDKEEIKFPWYKGKEGEVNCYVSTSELTSEDIIRFQDKVVKELGFKY